LVALVFFEYGFGPLEVYHGDAAGVHGAELYVFGGEVEGGFVGEDGYGLEHVLEKFTVGGFELEQDW